MAAKCFVPNCNNTVGISFPDDEEQKQKWLEALNITDIIPNESSFLCSDHFEDADKIPQEQDSSCVSALGLTLKKSQVSTETVDPEDEAEKNAEQNHEGDEENQEQSEMTEKDIPSEIPDENKVKSEVPEVIMFEEELRTCRLCMTEDINLLNIFEEEVIEDVPIVVSMLACLYPIEISLEDELSKFVCSTCLESLANCFRFRSVCLKNDKIQRQAVESKLQEKGVKRKTFQVPKRAIKRLCEESQSEEEMEQSKEWSYTENTAYQTPPKPPKPRSEIDAKFDKVEEELRKVLEGTLSEEQAASENIIIHIENDENEEEECEDTSETIPPSVPNRRVIIPGDEGFSVHEESDVGLPRGVGLKQSRGKAGVRSFFRSPVGVFHGVLVPFAFDTKFCLVDGYLFEFRLKIGDRREMKCLTPNCPACGYQLKTSSGLFGREVKIVKPHNHKPEDMIERKKLMFHYVMRKKVQNDKTINFKGVYEDVCKYDPKMRELVPLRDIINIICRNPFLQNVPTVRNFEHLYDEIEKETFEKFQFTFSGKQFFQEKFTAEDGAKAICFANSEFVSEVTDSELMYVDASFKIETNEKFSYQLVTVLVLVEDNYYPILFALINRKSQSIFRKIFEYLHDTLAPALRPDEIVTDYEADLYYALGETYLDSSIGGSVFYYAKNIYKKICTLDLAKDLENNSSFRTIYHMLMMLPLLPVNTIVDGLANIETQAKGLGLEELSKDVFEHINTEWIAKVTPDLFCVHRLENRINENVMAPFKKLRDLLTLSKGKLQKQSVTVVSVLNKVLDLEHFTGSMYEAPSKKTFIRNLSCSQKRNVLRAWQFIETHPKIHINNFFSKVVGYIKSMENQLWIWGYYRYEGDFNEELINATNFSIVSTNVDVVADQEGQQEEGEDEEKENEEEDAAPIVMEAVIDENGAVGFVLQNNVYKK